MSHLTIKLKGQTHLFHKDEKGFLSPVSHFCGHRFEPNMKELRTYFPCIECGKILIGAKGFIKKQKQELGESADVIFNSLLSIIGTTNLSSIEYFISAIITENYDWLTSERLVKLVNFSKQISKLDSELIFNLSVVDYRKEKMIYDRPKGAWHPTTAEIHFDWWILMQHSLYPRAQYDFSKTKKHEYVPGKDPELGKLIRHKEIDLTKFFIELSKSSKERKEALKLDPTLKDEDIEEYLYRNVFLPANRSLITFSFLADGFQLFTTKSTVKNSVGKFAITREMLKEKHPQLKDHPDILSYINHTDPTKIDDIDRLDITSWVSLERYYKNYIDFLEREPETLFMAMYPRIVRSKVFTLESFPHYSERKLYIFLANALDMFIYTTQKIINQVHIPTATKIYSPAKLNTLDLWNKTGQERSFFSWFVFFHPLVLQIKLLYQILNNAYDTLRLADNFQDHWSKIVALDENFPQTVNEHFIREAKVHAHEEEEEPLYQKSNLFDFEFIFKTKYYRHIMSIFGDEVFCRKLMVLEVTAFCDPFRYFPSVILRMLNV